MQLLEDTFIIENLQVINEGSTSGPMKIRGCFQRADEANNNKRIYKKPLLEREITKLAESITERRLMGELDHPQNDSVKLSNVSHLITGLTMKGNEVIGEAEILDTPSGKVAKALIEGGVKVGISSRGMGTVTEEMDGKRYVNEDFKLITWDLVADPSTRGAYPGLTESTQIQEIIDRVLPEAQKVKNFTTLLKEKLMVESTPAYKKIEARRKKLEGTIKYSQEQKEKEKAKKDESSTQFVNFMRDKLMEAKYMGDPKTRQLKRGRAYAKAAAAGGPRAIKRGKQGHGFNTTRWAEDEVAQAHAKGKKVPSRGSQSSASRSKVMAATKRRDKVHTPKGVGRETRRDAAADAAQDKIRRQAPEDR
tara:strand:- start:1211 stop:2302 length:1092 start_codon:yes stop_codon:yes gene_type:complete